MFKLSKKNMIIILVSVFVTIILFIIGLNIYSTNKDKNNKPSKFIANIIKRINNKDKFIIYLNDSPNTCGSPCTDIYDIVSYYEASYTLDFTEVNKSKLSNIDYKRLLEKLNYKEKDITYPSVVMIDNGKVKAVVNSVITEEAFKNALIENNYISAESELSDVQIDYDTFWNYYRSNDDKLILFYSYENPLSYEFRSRVLGLSRKYNFSYNVVYFGLASSSLIGDELDSKIDGGFTIPSLMIVSNTEVKDVVSLNDNAKIEEFLRKNNVITE